MPSTLLYLPVVVAIVYLVNWFALWFKPIQILLLGIQFSITGIFMLVLWLVLNKTSEVYHYGSLVYAAGALAIVGFISFSLHLEDIKTKLRVALSRRSFGFP